TEANRNALYRFFESIRTDAIKALELAGPCAVHIIEKMCDGLGLVHAVDPFEKEPATYGLAYFRLHGSPPGKTMYRYAYTDADLGRLRAICREYDDVYVMFNNLSMHADALRFGLALHDTADSSGAGREWHRHGNLCISGLSASTRLRGATHRTRCGRDGGSLSGQRAHRPHERVTVRTRHQDGR